MQQILNKNKAKVYIYTAIFTVALLVLTGALK